MGRSFGRVARYLRSMRSPIVARHRSAQSPSLLCALALVASTVALVAAEPARAMCGCMLARDPGPKVSSKTARITNTATKVVLVRDPKKERTTVIMSNDYDGDVQEFGIVIPVPSIVQK